MNIGSDIPTSTGREVKLDIFPLPTIPYGRLMVGTDVSCFYSQIPIIQVQIHRVRSTVLSKRYAGPDFQSSAAGKRIVQLRCLPQVIEAEVGESILPSHSPLHGKRGGWISSPIIMTSRPAFPCFCKQSQSIVLPR